MKNVKRELSDSLRPEYRRSDLGELIQGKYAGTRIDFVEIVGLLVSCIGEDEDIQFVFRSSHFADRKQGDWTYEIDDANQITLRYWLNEFESLERPISNSPGLTKTNLQNLLISHVRTLKARVMEL